MKRERQHSDEKYRYRIRDQICSKVIRLERSSRRTHGSSGDVDLPLTLNVRDKPSWAARKRAHFHSRHSLRIPRKRCYPLSPAKHQKILRPLRGDAPRSCL